MQAYRNGTLLATFYVEGVSNSTVYGFTGRFDELRIAFFSDVSARDAGNINGFSAGAIDHVRFGRP